MGQVNLQHAGAVAAPSPQSQPQSPPPQPEVLVSTPARTLTEAEFNAVKQRVLQDAPEGMDEAAFNAWVSQRLPQALAEAEGSPIGDRLKVTVNGQPFDAGTEATPQDTSALYPGTALAKNLLTGAAKGALSTGSYLATGAAKAGLIPGVTPEMAEARRAYDQQALEAHGVAQNIGKFVEQTGEFFLPGAKAEEAAAWITAKLAPHVASMPTAVKALLSLLPRLATEGTTGATITAAQGGNPVVGGVAGMAGPVITSVPAAAKYVASKFANPNQLEHAAAVYGEAAGVPIDAATASGRPSVRTAQKMSSASIGGAQTAERVQAAQSENLSRVGHELAEGANRGGAMQTPLSAGEGVINTLTQQAEQHAADATAAYGRLEAFEQAAQQRIARNAGQATAAPATSVHAFTRAPLAVDIAPTKAAMRPVYESLKREAELVPLMGDKAKALTELDRLMSAPDLAPLSVADQALGALKTVARVDQAVRRTAGQGIAAEAVKNLERAVTDSARRAGPDVYRALIEGRAATVAKYKALAALDMFGTEAAANNAGRVISPAKVYEKLTSDRDMALEALKTVRQLAPDQIPAVGRAYLEGLLKTAEAEGKFGHADRIWSEWKRMGDQTKAILFPDVAHRSNVGHFLLLAKNIAERGPNPSGTAYTWRAMNLASAAPMWVLAKILYSPKTSRAILHGVTSGDYKAVSALISQASAGVSSQAMK